MQLLIILVTEYFSSLVINWIGNSFVLLISHNKYSTEKTTKVFVNVLLIGYHFINCSVLIIQLNLSKKDEFRCDIKIDLFKEKYFLNT